MEVPTHFHFPNTVRILLRGNDDPLNKWIQNSWYRYLSCNAQFALVKVSQNKLGQSLVIQTMKGDMPSKLITQLIHRLLGLDDPLLLTSSSVLTRDARLESSWGTAIPGYASLFEGIVQTILGQQVAVAVANKVRRAFIIMFGQKIKYSDHEFFIFPETVQLQSIEPDNLLSLGMSRVKAKAICGMASLIETPEYKTMFSDNAVPTDTCRELLINAFGIGQWTANWFLLRVLRRFEVIPASDLAVRKAMSWWWNEKTLLTADDIEKKSTTLGENKGALVHRILCEYLKK